MSAGEARYPYRIPVWMGLISGLAAYLVWVGGATAPGFFWWLFRTLSAFLALGPVITIVGRARRSEIVLTDAGLTVPHGLGRSRHIAFTEVDQLRLRDTSGRILTAMDLDIGTPARRTTLTSRLFASDLAFLEAVAAIGDRMAVAGGPALVEYHPRPPGFR